MFQNFVFPGDCLDRVLVQEAAEAGTGNDVRGHPHQDRGPDRERSRGPGLKNGAKFKNRISRLEKSPTCPHLN